MANKPYVGDIGTVILVDCEGDISDATVSLLLIRKPKDDEEVQWSAAIYQEAKAAYLADVDPEGKVYNKAARAALPDPLTRRLRYVVQDGDFDQDGYYEGNSYIESPAWQGRGETFRFRVFDHYEKG